MVKLTLEKLRKMMLFHESFTSISKSNQKYIFTGILNLFDELHKHDMNIKCLTDKFATQKVKITSHISHISYLEPKQLTTDRYTKEVNNIAQRIWREQCHQEGVIRLSYNTLGNEQVHSLQKLFCKIKIFISCFVDLTIKITEIIVVIMGIVKEKSKLVKQFKFVLHEK
jgi:hypothetical protein